MFVVLVAHRTIGLETSVAVVERTIKDYFADDIEVDTIIVPEQLTRVSAAVNEQRILIHKPIDVVIFFEHIVNHAQLGAARHRILIPNPEWLRAAGLESRLTEMWHKTHISRATLARLLPKLRHSYIGFTSPDLFGGVPDFDRFIHSKEFRFKNRQRLS
jgi:hypothetical protein